ncbi:hypothetical protein BG61_18930 [Caballeronia glathei]|uniref:Uncharacterized protein n=1 Tax=Caballeronia glathei TaxID=60547 RepID=A0A069PV48_9BURK|nr:hypothetical protein BG61_18930 [Caballeronia glathei]
MAPLKSVRVSTSKGFIRERPPSEEDGHRPSRPRTQLTRRSAMHIARTPMRLRARERPTH